MAKFDCIADFEALTGPEALNSAELALIAACRAGDPCHFGKDRPTAATQENTIRAALLRVLIIGGTPECGLSANGVRLKGAWIKGQLDLSFRTAKGPTHLRFCNFKRRPILNRTELFDLNLDYSRIPGLWAQHLRVSGHVSLSNLVSRGSVHLAGAHIAGQLRCENSVFYSDRDYRDGSTPQKFALNAQGLRVGQGVFLNGLWAKHGVDLGGAEITGQLICDEIMTNHPKNKVELEPWVFNGQSLRVTLMFSWENVDFQNDRPQDTESPRKVHLADAHVGTLLDDMESWPKDLYLDGFTYDRIAKGKITAQDRLPWLANGSNHNGIFHPQPYTQLAKVLFAMGHDHEAKKILIERENRLSTVALQNLRTKPNGGTYLIFENPLIDAQVCGTKAWFWTIRLLAGHGYAPFRALVAMLALIAVTTFLAYQAWSTGAFAPNSDVIVTSDTWQAVMMTDCVPAPFPGCDLNPAQTWSNDRAQGVDWASFNAWAYAVDLALPVVELGQTSAWSPSKDRGIWGETLWWASWWIELLGWLFTVLGGAAITGLIQRNRD